MGDGTTTDAGVRTRGRGGRSGHRRLRVTWLSYLAASVLHPGRPAEVEGRVKGAPGVRVHPSREGHVYLKVSLIFSPACLRLPLA